MVSFLVQRKHWGVPRLFLPVLVVIAVLLVFSGCHQHPISGQAHLLPIRCHQEIERGMLQGTGVNLLFITLENRGSDAGPAMMTVAFNTNSSARLRVQLEVKTPTMPAGAERWITVDLPLAPDGTRVLEPVGKIVITIGSTNAVRPEKRANGILVTSCHDLT